MGKTLVETGDKEIWRCGKVIREEDIWTEREQKEQRVKAEVVMENKQAEVPTRLDRLKRNSVRSAFGQVR
jgi:hypothetical protein